MIINEFEYFPFSLNLKTPFQNSNHTLYERKGFIIKAQDEFGNIAFGECSPLPDFSKESLNDAQNDIIRLNKNGLFNLPTDLDDIEKELDIYNLYNSVRFAFEQIIISLLLMQDRVSVIKYFGGMKSSINVNSASGFGDLETLLGRISKKLYEGYKTIKLKVGRDDTREDHILLEETRLRFGKNFYLRIDANRKWSCDEAIEYLDRFKEFDIQYVEEPCEYCCSTIKTMDFSFIPIALDESLGSFEEALSLLHSCRAEFFVIKPMVLGSMIKTFKFMREAEQLNKNVVISSAFESAIGKSGIVFLASLTRHNYAHGLDTLEYFEKDLCTDFYNVNKGIIAFNINTYPLKCDFELI